MKHKCQLQKEEQQKIREQTNEQPSPCITRARASFGTQKLLYSSENIKKRHQKDKKMSSNPLQKYCLNIVCGP
jgi:hypothetical protein